MFSVKNSLAREKKFRVVQQDSRGRGSHHFAATLTDDHTLFLLHQQRDKLEKKAGKSRRWRFGF